MEPHMDKENLKVKTKIPLPVAPLPALPQHLIKKVTDRQPLNILAGPNTRNVPYNVDQNRHCSAGPSNAKCKLITKRPKSPFKIDTKFVTVRRGCEDSGLNFIAYRDDKRRRSVPSVICISSDDEEHDSNGMTTYFSDKDGFRRASASTPAYHNLQILQPARIKNIKRSLKRPHSRELQGLSPTANRQKVDDDRVRRRLNFNQSIRERMRSPDLLQKSYMEVMDREYLVDILTYLLHSEQRAPSVPRVRNETRACVINWMMKINGVDGNPATIQTALWYLDSVLATGHVALDNMQLVAAASYWIAAKIIGPLTPASKLVRYANNAFEVPRLLEAEKTILARLKYPRTTVLAQDFICYFAWRCNKDRPGQIEVAATFLCLCGMMVNRGLCQEYPSVVAAASIRNALLLLDKKELMPRLQKCSIFVAAENKATSMAHTCAILRHAVRTVASKDYQYNFILEQYGTPPKFISQTIVTAANELAAMDTSRSAAVF